MLLILLVVELTLWVVVKPRFDKGDVRRKKNMPNNFFGWFVGAGSIAYGKGNPSAAGAYLI